LARVPFGVSDPVWVDDEGFDIDRHVHRTLAGEIGAATDIVMSVPLDRERPLWEMWVADRLRDGRVGGVGKPHHAVIGGLAAVERASLVLDGRPEPPVAEDDEWRPRPAPGSAQAHLVAAPPRHRASPAGRPRARQTGV